MAKNRVNGAAFPSNPDPEDSLPPCVEDSGVPQPEWAIPSPDASETAWTMAHDAAFKSLYPTLHSWMVLGRTGGKARKVGSIVIFCEDGRWKACVNDKQSGQVAFVSGDSWDGLLGAIDRGLKAGSLDWRVSKRK